MFTTPEIVINLLVDSLVYLFLLLAISIAVRIVLFFNPQEDTPLQYRLQKQSYLLATIALFALALKIPLFFYFVYALDKLSNIIPGAMCAAGVVTANRYGVWLFLTKLLGIYLFSLWIILHLRDMERRDYLLTKRKFLLFIVIFLVATVEYLLLWLYLLNLDLGKVVSCCGVLFNPVKSSSLFGPLLSLPPKIVALSPYLLLLIAFVGRGWLFRLAHLLLIPASILAIILFFSPYIYELPTHHCPFCLLQKEYSYVGYLIYVTLFLGTTFGLVGDRKRALFFDTIALGILSGYVVGYYWKNGVWLF
ncbi:MAG: hypothetical protein GXO19_04220 [Epsilonproteobacteria bacterium]|nr:hypothetical protein [Campylobacterota bacterium]NPA56928.1 hypothetical protein [Campylobacterota bacterium]